VLSNAAFKFNLRRYTAAMDAEGVEGPDTETRGKIRDAILAAIFDTHMYSSRPEERCAACIWLLALVRDLNPKP
jgi:hypothetical protein